MNVTASDEKARLLLLKICNGMIGKCKLSSQQVMSHLQGIPNRYMDHTFQTFWWMLLLKFILKQHFNIEGCNEDDFVMIHDINMHTMLADAE